MIGDYGDFSEQWWLNSPTNPSTDYQATDSRKPEALENFSSAVSLLCGSCRQLGVRLKFCWDQGAAVAVNTTVLLAIRKVSLCHFASGDRLRRSKPLENFPALPAKIESQNL